ncbi:MAG TPA: FGGY-family carbohydrate kinase [Acidimicrobiales bacterium]|nr:FGGY-family carbohydrate kinase [Acidimicrobiales bacterium]
MRYLIGIDNGSQSTKVSVFDEHGGIVCAASQPLRRSDTPRPGIVEHPDDDLWLSICEASRRVMAAFPGDRKDIVAAGLCTIRFCRALLRADGTLASPVMSWMDERVSRPHEPRDDVAFVTTSSGYITHRMTAALKDTAANYQGVWPISTDRWEWLRDDEGFAQYHIRRDMLFELVMPGDLLGEVTPEAARQTGIPAGLPVYATANDKAVEALGCGLRAPGTLLVSLGTYIASMTTGKENRQGTSFWSNFACLPREYLYESSGIRRGMWTVSWWRDLLGSEVALPAERAGVPAERYLDEQAAAAVPAGSDGLMVVLDWLAPTERRFRRGSILGFDVRHGRLHIHRAILEGIALTTHRCATAMGEEVGEGFDRLVISGGGAASDLLMQIFADVFGIEATRTTVNSAVGLGSAICAAVGHDLYHGFEEALDAMVAWQPPFPPERDHHELYSRMQAVYDSIPAATDPIFERSYSISDEACAKERSAM